MLESVAIILSAITFPCKQKEMGTSFKCHCSNCSRMLLNRKLNEEMCFYHLTFRADMYVRVCVCVGVGVCAHACALSRG